MALIDTVTTTKVTIPTVLRPHAAVTGRLPADLMRNFDGRGNLFVPVSYAMQALHIAAWGDGVKGFGFEPARIDTETVGRYRSYDQQVNLFRSRYAPSPATSRGAKTWNGVLWYNQRGAGAASPGTSNHGLGLADDVAEESDGTPGAESMSDNQLRWMRDNAPKFGFGLETRKERWHWHWIGGDRLPQLVVNVLHVSGIKIPSMARFGFVVPSPSGVVVTPPVKPPALVVPAPPLKEGDSGTRVSALQSIMKTHGWYNFAVDGQWGPKTTAAVKLMQAAIKTTPDGGYGSITAARLRTWLSATVPPKPSQPPPPASGNLLLTTVPGAMPWPVNMYPEWTTWLQTVFKQRGWWTGPTDGNWTPTFQARVSFVQSEFGMDNTTGVWTQESAERIRAWLLDQ